MSRTIYIQNSAGLAPSSASVTDPNAVADGKIVLLDVAGAQVGLGADPAPDSFLIVRGTAADGRRSGIIERKNIVGATFEEHAAAVNQVTTITPTAGSVAAGRARLNLTRIDSGHEQYPRINYEIQVDAGDSATDICNKFRTVINAAKASASTINNNQRHFIEASGTATLILTAVTVPMDEQGTPTREHISFNTALEGDAVDGWTVAGTAAPFNGTGTYSQVAEYERRSFGNLGFYYTEHYPQVPASHATSGVEYDLFTLQVANDASREINRSFEIHEYVFAVVAGQLDKDDLMVQFGLQDEEPPA